MDLQNIDTINKPNASQMLNTNSTHYSLTLITTMGFIATVVMAVLNITPTMDLQNIDTINTPNASQMLNTNSTVPHPTIQCLLYEVFFNTIYLDSTPKHFLQRQDKPLYP
eukprot:339004_1